MVQLLNQFIQKWMPVLTPLSLVIGVLLEKIGTHFLFLVPVLFAVMTFISSLNLKFRDIIVFKQYPKTILFVIAFLHILMPLWAFFLAELIFDDRLLTIGFLISVAVPTGVTSVIWVTICKGNLPLSLAIILIDTLLAPILMPLILHLVVGESISLNTSALIFDLIWMIVLPSILGILVNEWTKGKLFEQYGKPMSLVSKLCLFGIIMINSSAIAPYVKTIDLELAKVIAVVLFLAVSGYVFSLVLGRLLWKSEADQATFVFNGGMRNIAVGVVIATTYFPSKVAMPVVFGMLFQQVLASIFYKIIRKNSEAV
ncbi:predicted Na+-dependent transporter [Solibacillus silvestris StLB046]|uniref:Predicted Na+-dependent transporter n=1 Tax=Solibacillus silvestris (strain StLB046) TaxID=1002809 RepID=F2F6J6_SOLSS|nr:bile acid:sodium symporter family protein [Solibacillus silvestris]BAK15438.1 predicted Na+-dependent transporter [Solibacillus silvestris StLB046]